MYELPEARVIASQVGSLLKGKTIRKTVANGSPHKFAWFSGDPREYDGKLKDRTIGEARSWGGFVEIECGSMRLLFGDGVNLRFHADISRLPGKHQLLLEFTDGSFLAGVVQMYGGMWAFEDGENDNPYFLAAKRKPSPLSPGFDREYFSVLRDGTDGKLPLKAFLATDQRVPGLGNGVLQDILFTAGLHPKRKLGTLSPDAMDALFSSMKKVLADMTAKGGRDTERDLSGNPGGYATLMSRNTVGKPCPRCGTGIEKLAFMGGSVYVCPSCQQ